MWIFDQLLSIFFPYLSCMLLHRLTNTANDDNVARCVAFSAARPKLKIDVLNISQKYDNELYIIVFIVTPHTLNTNIIIKFIINRPSRGGMFQLRVRLFFNSLKYFINIPNIVDLNHVKVKAVFIRISKKKNERRKRK